MDRLDSIGSADSTDQYPAFVPSDLRRRRLSSARQVWTLTQFDSTMGGRKQSYKGGHMGEAYW